LAQAFHAAGSILLSEGMRLTRRLARGWVSMASHLMAD
jgi:hypothetical protein